MCHQWLERTHTCAYTQTHLPAVSYNVIMAPTESNYTESIGLVYLLGASQLSITAWGNVRGGSAWVCARFVWCVCACEVSFKMAPALSVAGMPLRDFVSRNCSCRQALCRPCTKTATTTTYDIANSQISSLTPQLSQWNAYWDATHRLRRCHETMREMLIICFFYFDCKVNSTPAQVPPRIDSATLLQGTLCIC